MISQQNKITPFQLAIFLIHAQIGVDMIALVNNVHMEAYYDSWISVIVAGVFIQILIFAYSLLLLRFPNHTFFEILKIVFGKKLGKVIIATYCIFFAILCSILLAKYTVVLKSWMMPLTPKWILALFIILLGIYAAIDNIKVISRFLLLATVVIFLFLGFVIYSLKSANFYHILPIGNAGVVSILKGTYRMTISYQGFEYFLYVTPLIIGGRKQVIKAATYSNVFITFFYTFVVLTCNLFFTPEEIKLIPEPIFYLIKSFTFNIIERPDLIFTSLWIALVVTSVIILLYIASTGFTTLFPTKKRFWFVIIVATVSYIVSIVLYGESRIKILGDILRPIILIMSIGIPLVTIVMSYLHRRTGETKQ